MPVLKDPKHEKYAQLLAAGQMNDVDAHEAAGFKRNKGNASRLKTNENIQSRIRELVEIGAEKAGVTIARVLDEMACVAFSDMGNFVDVDDNGNVAVNFKKMAKGDLRSVTKLRQKHLKGEDGDVVVETQFELASKTTGLEQLAKHLGMFIERSKIEQEVKYVIGDSMSEEDATATNDDWANKFQPPANGAGRANGHS